MSEDVLITMFISRMHQMIRDENTDLSNARFDNMYEVGVFQGRIHGLRAAMGLLESVLEAREERN